MSGVSAVVLIKAETQLINELAEQLVEVEGRRRSVFSCGSVLTWWLWCASARTMISRM